MKEQTLRLDIYRDILPATTAHDVISVKDITLGTQLTMPSRGILLLDFQ